MNLKHIVQDSRNVVGSQRLLGNIRAFLYIGATVFLVIVYILNHR